MLTSEEDAAKAWCPFVRRIVSVHHPVSGDAMNATSANRSTEEGLMGACAGSKCMSWRWAGWENKDFGTIAPGLREEHRTGPRLGYCGLAGKPYGAP